MPSSFIGLVIFIAFLVPGFVHSVQRQGRVPQRKLSPLGETTAIATISLFTGAAALGLFAVARLLMPSHTPDIERLLRDGGDYAYPRVGYVFAWAISVLAVSCTFAFVIGLQPKWLSAISKRFAPIIVDTSLWYQVFDDDIPEDTEVFAGCDMKDGAYVEGYVEWFSTESSDVSDRDLVLSRPIKVTRDAVTTDVEFARVVLSARDIARIYVSYLSPTPDADDQPAEKEPAELGEAVVTQYYSAALHHLRPHSASA